jgi:two-component system sensor histidine kinase PilS (NtrC family)
MKPKGSKSKPDRMLRGAIPETPSVLQWVYLGRVIVPTVVFAAAVFYLRAVPPETLAFLASASIAALIVSALSFWHTHVRGREPGATFLYAQALFDLALVTTLVHVTEGTESQFAALYVIVIAVSAVLMPVASSLLITALASVLYVADIIWWQRPEQLTMVVGLQLAVFVGVFTITGVIAGRLRLGGVEREEELRQEVRRLRLEASDILRNIKSGVVTVDDAGRIAFINPAALELLGLPDEDITGRPLEELVGDRAPELVRAVRTALQGRRRTFRSEADVRLSDRVFPIGVTATVIELEPGAAPSVTAIFTDISDQKRLEELHLRTERLEAVAELSASLAHEIKNPLASIRSSVEQLSRSTRADDDERFLAGLVVRESDRLSRLLSEFLDFSRVRVTESRPLDLGQVARAAVDVVLGHPECPPDLMIGVEAEPAQLEGDEDLLHRVVVNLVLNAVQATGGQGTIRVEVREASGGDLPSAYGFDAAALLRVSDDGPGIPPDLRDRLFDPFVTGRTGGSGLGLAIVQRAVQAHRGAVFVDSAPGRGTTFTVLLPTRGAREVAA